MTPAHPRPWKKAYAKTFDGNGAYPVYIVDAEGRKICPVWGKDGEREATVDLIIRAVRIYDRAQQLKAARAAQPQALILEHDEPELAFDV